MYQGPPKDVALHLDRMDRKVPKGESSIEYFIDVVQEYDQSEFGVEALAEYALTGVKPPSLVAYEDMSVPRVNNPSPAPALRPRPNGHHQALEGHGDRRGKRLPLQTGRDDSFDHSVRSQWNTSMSWSTSQAMTNTPARKYADHKALTRKR